MVVPYRRWPQAAAVFHGMLCRAERLNAVQAHDAGIVAELALDYASLIRQAVARVHTLAGTKRATLDGAVAVAPFDATAPAGKQVLSREVTGIIEQAVQAAAAAPTLAAALEIGYQAFGRSACTAAAREGIGAFNERRRPDYAKTG
jgi:enoyl-CoA hydratase/3-hydroxyacyl-CoA dehydrogenase